MAAVISIPALPLFTSAFQALPVPVIILSLDYTIVVANSAGIKLFPNHGDLTGRDVRTLPIRWQDGDREAFHRLLTAQSLDDEQSLDISGYQTNTSVILELQVEIHDISPDALSTARLSLTNLSLPDRTARMLTFEAIQDVTHVFESMIFQGRDKPSSGTEDTPVPFEESIPGTKESTTTSQDHLQATFAQFRDAFYYSNPEVAGFILSADEKFCLPNYRPDENAAPVEIDDIAIFFDNWDMWTANFSRKLPYSEFPSVLLNKHRKKFLDWRYGMKEDDKLKIVQVSGDPLYDRESGQYIGGVVWTKTLGEYNDVVAADLAASLRDVRSLAERLPHLLWSVDVDGNADYFSQSWYEFTGLSESESSGLGFQQAIHPVDLQKLLNKFAASTVTKKIWNGEARYRRADGQWIWMGVRAKPLLDAAGNIVKWFGTTTDIDSLVTERDEAQRLKDRLMGMLLLADVGLFEVHANWKLIMLDGRMQWLKSQDAVIDILRVLDDMADDGATVFRKNLAQVMEAQKEDAIFETQIASRWYKFRLVGDTDQRSHSVSAKKVLGCSVDITEQRTHAALSTENARLASEASLQIEKNRLRTAFLAHMSHELRTPIAGIVGSADILLDVCHSDEQVGWVKDIQISAEHLLTIVNDILDLSKAEAGELELESVIFDIHQLILQTLKQFGPIAHIKGLQLTCLQDLSHPYEVVGDMTRVKQILMNLISNAVKFTFRGFVRLNLSIKGGKISVCVEDTGDGIDKETMATLFRPFVQGDASTARRYGGTGLGLTISRNLAEMMNGTIVLRSEPLGGTKATLVIPLILPSSSDDRPATPRRSIESATRDPTTFLDAISHTNHDSKALILIAEDNAINQKIALNMVRKLGYHVAAVWNGQEALNYVEEENKQLPSLILMDCQMPRLDGYGAVQELRSNPRYRHAKSVPVVALTASAIQGDKEKCRAAGMDDYLSKPVTKAQLQVIIEKWIKQA